jgi:uncharacterized phage protein (TIGR02220 family)
MASTYHPFYDTLWNDDKLEGASFEGKAFFAYLFTNPRVRPSGIYRVTDAQLAADTGLPMPRVRVYLADLHVRALIVRDGAWIFVRSYFKRQPKPPHLVNGVLSDLEMCSSEAILDAFSEKYPVYSQRISQRIPQRMGDPGMLTRPTEQSRAEQSNAEQGTVDQPFLPRAPESSTNGPKPNAAPARRQEALAILVFLNRKAEKHFPPDDVNLGLITARLREGASAEQCRAVIARKVARWKGDPEMTDFLRPKTLFGKTNFAQYLGELPATAFDAPEVRHDT